MGHRTALGRAFRATSDDPETALLRLRSVNVDQDGQPFEAFTAWYRADRASFEISVSPT